MESSSTSQMRDQVSVMMPAYNAGQYIGQAIESLLAQTYPDWELVIVNDGSTDNTVDVVLHYVDQRIRLIHKENGGEASARNTALQYLRGEFVAFLDADDLYLPQHLELSVGYLQSHPEYDGIYTDGYYCNSNRNQLQTLSSRRRGPFEGDVFEEVTRSSDVFGPPVCVLLRREPICRSMLEFDPRIVIGPDWDFLTRYSERARFGYLKSCTCLYRLHGTNITFRVNLHKRASYLALCRENAIQLARFMDCSLQVRWFVFYDLLVNLLTGNPVRQNEIIQWEQFRTLPLEAQGQIMRLMASQAIMNGVRHPCVDDWIYHSRQLNPADRRGSLLNILYHVHPGICRIFLLGKTWIMLGRRETSLFGKMG